MAGGRSLSEYVDEWATEGEEAFRRKHPSPVLVLEDASVDEDEERSFHTGYMEREVLRETIEAPRPSRPPPPPPNEQDVWEIAKRPGAPFKDRIGVGRAPNADVSVPFPRISKYHAYFSEEPDGSHTLTDAGSKNGTWVDDGRLGDKEPVVLRDGAYVRLGPYGFRFHTADGFCALVSERAG